MTSFAGDGGAAATTAGAGEGAGEVGRDVLGGPLFAGEAGSRFRARDAGCPALGATGGEGAGEGCVDRVAEDSGGVVMGGLEGATLAARAGRDGFGGATMGAGGSALATWTGPEPRTDASVI